MSDGLNGALSRSTVKTLFETRQKSPEIGSKRDPVTGELLETAGEYALPAEELVPKVPLARRRFFKAERLW